MIFPLWTSHVWRPTPKLFLRGLESSTISSVHFATLGKYLTPIGDHDGALAYQYELISEYINLMESPTMGTVSITCIFAIMYSLLSLIGLLSIPLISALENPHLIAAQYARKKQTFLASESVRVEKTTSYLTNKTARKYLPSYDV